MFISMQNFFSAGRSSRKTSALDCSKNLVYYGSYGDCHSYYQCFDRYSAPFKRSCGFLMFNPVISTCDWPANVVKIRSECRKTNSNFPPNSGANSLYVGQKKKKTAIKKRRRKHPGKNYRQEVAAPQKEEEEQAAEEEVQEEENLMKEQQKMPKAILQIPQKQLSEGEEEEIVDMNMVMKPAEKTKFGNDKDLSDEDQDKVIANFNDFQEMLKKNGIKLGTAAAETEDDDDNKGIINLLLPNFFPVTSSQEEDNNFDTRNDLGNTSDEEEMMVSAELLMKEHRSMEEDEDKDATTTTIRRKATPTEIFFGLVTAEEIRDGVEEIVSIEAAKKFEEEEKKRMEEEDMRKKEMGEEEMRKIEMEEEEMRKKEMEEEEKRKKQKEREEKRKRLQMAREEKRRQEKEREEKRRREQMERQEERRRLAKEREERRKQKELEKEQKRKREEEKRKQKEMEEEEERKRQEMEEEEKRKKEMEEEEKRRQEIEEEEKRKQEQEETKKRKQQRRLEMDLRRKERRKNKNDEMEKKNSRKKTESEEESEESKRKEGLLYLFGFDEEDVKSREEEVENYMDEMMAMYDSNEIVEEKEEDSNNSNDIKKESSPTTYDPFYPFGELPERDIPSKEMTEDNKDSEEDGFDPILNILAGIPYDDNKNMINDDEKAIDNENMIPYSDNENMIPYSDNEEMIGGEKADDNGQMDMKKRMKALTFPIPLFTSYNDHDEKEEEEEDYNFEEEHGITKEAANKIFADLVKLRRNGFTKPLREREEKAEGEEEDYFGFSVEDLKAMQVSGIDLSGLDLEFLEANPELVRIGMKAAANGQQLSAENAVLGAAVNAGQEVAKSPELAQFGRDLFNFAKLAGQEVLKTGKELNKMARDITPAITQASNEVLNHAARAGEHAVKTAQDLGDIGQDLLEKAGQASQGVGQEVRKAGDEITKMAQNVARDVAPVIQGASKEVLDQATKAREQAMKTAQDLGNMGQDLLDKAGKANQEVMEKGDEISKMGKDVIEGAAQSNEKNNHINSISNFFGSLSKQANDLLKNTHHLEASAKELLASGAKMAADAMKKSNCPCPEHQGSIKEEVQNAIQEAVTFFPIPAQPTVASVMINNHNGNSNSDNRPLFVNRDANGEVSSVSRAPLFPEPLPQEAITFQQEGSYFPINNPKVMADCINVFLNCVDFKKRQPHSSQTARALSCEDMFQECSGSSKKNSSPRSLA